MTYEEIIQALRQCAKRDCLSCGMCPIFPDRECVEHLAAAAASLIERLTAENAELREEVYSMSGEWCAMMSVLNSIGSYDRLRELAEADKDGRVVVLPCKVGERWADEDGRAVRITAVIVSIEPFGTNINIYFDHEDATPDDAGSDCAANWDYFSRHYTCIEVERAMEDKKDG